LTALAAPELEALDRARARVGAALAGSARILCVTSGKGGVGKSAVAVQLALALGARGFRVALFDADLQGPSLASMLGLRGRPVAVRGAQLQPAAGPRGLRVQSMDFLLQGNQPLAWDGPAGEAAALRSALEQAALADLIATTAWGELDYWIADLAPGADRLPAIAQLLPRCEALAVAIPSQVALLQVERSLRRAREARIPVLGLVLNMAELACDHCGHTNAPYGARDLAEQLRSLDVECLARIPFDRELADALDTGRVGAPPGVATRAIDSAFRNLAARIDELAGKQEEAW
jgi:ATP-binding protein involved in chromosome partitioning